MTNEQLHVNDRSAIEQELIPIRKSLSALISKWFGDRCAMFDQNCVCCKLWRHYDALTVNPFDDGDHGSMLQTSELRKIVLNESVPRGIRAEALAEICNDHYLDGWRDGSVQ